MHWGFVGAKSMGTTILTALIEKYYTPAFIVTLTNQSMSEIADFKALADRSNCELLQSNDLLSYQDRLSECDVVLVSTYNLIPENLLSLPRFGFINIHPSLLPKYRGVHPISWALIHDETKTGVSVHRIDAGVDTGNILLQAEHTISAEEDIHSLSRALSHLGGTLAVRCFDDLARTQQAPTGVPQKGPSSYARRRTPDDSRIDWHWSTRQIHRFISALQSPYPLAFCHDPQNNLIKFNKAQRSPTYQNSNDVGRVLEKTDDHQYLIQCGDGAMQFRTRDPLKSGWILH